MITRIDAEYALHVAPKPPFASSIKISNHRVVSNGRKHLKAIRAESDELNGSAVD